MTEVPQEVQREIQILSENDHPFLMQMAGSLVLRVEGCVQGSTTSHCETESRGCQVKSMQTHSHIYVLAEYVGGGELLSQKASVALGVEAVCCRWPHPESLLRLYAAMRSISTVFTRQQAMSASQICCVRTE